MQSPTNKFLNLERVSLLLLRSFPYKKAAEAAYLLNILQNLFNISFTINNTHKIHVLFLFHQLVFCTKHFFILPMHALRKHSCPLQQLLFLHTQNKTLFFSFLCLLFVLYTAFFERVVPLIFVLRII